MSPRKLATRFTDERTWFVLDASVYQHLKMHDLITSPKAADESVAASCCSLTRTIARSEHDRHANVLLEAGTQTTCSCVLLVQATLSPAQAASGTASAKFKIVEEIPWKT